MSKKPKYTMEPIGDNVVVQRNTATDTTPGGIVLPDKARETSRLGTVIAVGPGALRFSQGYTEGEGILDRYPMQCKVGDRVLLPFTAEMILLNPDEPESEVVVCHENQLLAIMR